LARLPSEPQRHDRLCELNVIEQVVNVCHTTVVRGAWARSGAGGPRLDLRPGRRPAARPGHVRHRRSGDGRLLRRGVRGGGRRTQPCGRRRPRSWPLNDLGHPARPPSSRVIPCTSRNPGGASPHQHAAPSPATAARRAVCCTPAARRFPPASAPAPATRRLAGAGWSRGAGVPVASAGPTGPARRRRVGG
jgi:hypothetical protein